MSRTVEVRQRRRPCARLLGVSFIPVLPEQVAAELGISRPTLYRELRKRRAGFRHG
ncbi:MULTISPECIES: hypothetical protein [unclassified Streptomyces]|uniref:hypothetical protein n=1 Tax=unclassified Streptomyces TaxID=2593676 RepID=UPI0035E234F1